MEFGLGRTNTGVECVRQRAFSLSEQFYRNLPSGILFPPPCLPAAWEEEARELQSSVKLNGGNKFWAISGQWARSSRAMHILHTSAIFIFVNGHRAIFAKADRSLRKELKICNTLTLMAAAKEKAGLT